MCSHSVRAVWFRTFLACFCYCSLCSLRPSTLEERKGECCRFTQVCCTLSNNNVAVRRRNRSDSIRFDLVCRWGQQGSTSGSTPRFALPFSFTQHDDGWFVSSRPVSVEFSCKPKHGRLPEKEDTREEEKEKEELRLDRAYRLTAKT